MLLLAWKVIEINSSRYPRTTDIESEKGLVAKPNRRETNRRASLSSTRDSPRVFILMATVEHVNRMWTILANVMPAT